MTWVIIPFKKSFTKWGGEASPGPFYKRSILILLPHWCKISRPHLMLVPSYWTWTKSTPQKIILRVKCLWNWGYDNFSHRNARVTKFWSHYHIHNIICVIWQNFVGDVTERIYDVIWLMQPISLTSSKLQPCFLKQPLKTQKSWKNRNYALKCNL